MSFSRTAAIAATIAVAIVLLAIRSAAEASGPRDLTSYRGPIGHSVDFPAASGGGTITVTLTSDQLYLTRVDVEGLVSRALNPSTGQIVDFGFSQELYFDPGVDLSSGSFVVVYQDRLWGALRGEATVRGHVDSDAVLTGTVQWALVGSSRAEFPAASWDATAGEFLPPALEDSAHSAPFTDRDGGITYTVNPNGDITSVAIKVPLDDPCFARREISVPLVYTVPLSPGPTGSTRYVRDEAGFLQVSILHVAQTTDGLEGDLIIGRFYVNDCQLVAHWRTAPAAPTPLVSATPAAPTPTGLALPGAGAGPRQTNQSFTVVGLAAAGAVLFFVAGTIARRAR